LTTLLARHAAMVATMDAARREIAGGGLFARNGIIEQVGPDETLPATADIVLDLTGQILLPGLINCHHHLDQTLTRALPAAQNAGLFGWLRTHYPIWARRTPAASRTATLIGCAELALSGCTTVFDHAYLFQNGCRVDDQIAAAAELGIRFMAARGSMSIGQSKGGLPPDDCVEDEAAILADCERVIAAYHDPAHGAMTRIVLAPCSPFSVSEGLMRDTAAMARARGVRLHTHLCETLDEEAYTLAHFNRRPVAHMEALDWIGPDVWFAHAVHVNAPEIALFGRTRTGICHCPCSNMRLGSGIAPIAAYRAAGVPAGLGVDGSASNDGNGLLAEARQAMLLSRLPATPWLSARDALEMATIGGATVLGRNDIGSLEAGNACDFFSIDLNVPAFAGALADPIGALLFCAPQPARHTVVHGRPIVSDGRITTMDMQPIVAEHNGHASRLLCT
jgi:cytosine/adenosine deaminase-related metal-dependent hydrolase